MDSLDDAVATATGKFAVYWHRVADTTPDSLSRIVEALEADPNAGAARSNASLPMAVVRRWSLLDPDAPSSVVSVDTPASAIDQFAPGQFADPDWTFPPFIDDLPVQRQRPEEEGHLPSWASR